MNFTVDTSVNFVRVARRFFRQHPELRARFEELVEALQQDPFQPSLRLHALGGRLAGLHAVSLTYAYRVTLTLRISERTITLVDIGSHDAVYR